MQVIYDRCCGLAVNKKLVVACLLVKEEKGQFRKEVRRFSTTTANLLSLVDWLIANKCQKVAIESGGLYWRPIFNLLEGQLEVVVFTAAQVPGHKARLKDSEGIAELLAQGLIKANCLPPQEQSQLRDLMRFRSRLVADRTRTINRLHKVLEEARQSAVAGDVSEVSVRAILTRLLITENAVSLLPDLTRGRPHQKKAELERALGGRLAEHHCFLLIKQLAQLDFLNKQINEFNLEIERSLTQQLWGGLLDKLKIG